MEHTAWIKTSHNRRDDDVEEIEKKPKKIKIWRQEFHELDCGCLCSVWFLLLFFANGFMSISVWVALRVPQYQYYNDGYLLEIGVDHPASRDTFKVLCGLTIMIFILNGALCFTMLILGLRTECYKTLQEMKWAILFAIFTLVITLGTIILVAAIFITEKSHDSKIKSDEFKLEMLSNLQTEQDAGLRWRNVQTSLKCCGVVSYKDWEETYGDLVPDSCCVNKSSNFTKKCTMHLLKPNGTICRILNTNGLSNLKMCTEDPECRYYSVGFQTRCGQGQINDPNNVYKDGCFDKLKILLTKKMRDSYTLVYSPLIAVTGIYILQLLSIWLWFRSNIPIN